MRDDLRREADRLRRQLERLESRIAGMERFPKSDPHDDGTVLKFYKRFDEDNPDAKMYLYVALRIDHRWYLSGENSMHRSRYLSWGKLVEFMGDTCGYCVWRAVGWDKAHDAPRS